MFYFQFGGGGGGTGGQFTRHFIADILSEDPGRMKKQRTSFSGWQIYELERIFEEKKYINSEERSSLGRSVSVTEHRVVYMTVVRDQGLDLSNGEDKF